MGRALRVDVGGLAYHVLNRGNGCMSIFDDEEDYAAFERVLAEAVERYAMRLCAYCLMPNHWHLVVWPREDGDLSRFTGWLTLTHTQRWHAQRSSTGGGHVYQGRYKSFVIQQDEHFLTACRYVERNALRAGLVDRAQDWLWSSLHLRQHADRYEGVPELSRWPVDRPSRWVWRVNQPENEAELEALRRSASRGNPYGQAKWIDAIVRKHNLQTTVRPRGRPRKSK